MIPTFVKSRHVGYETRVFVAKVCIDCKAGVNRAADCIKSTQRSTIAAFMMFCGLYAYGEPTWPPLLDLTNSFLYLVPVIAWNIALSRYLDLDRFFPGDAPGALLVSEAIIRSATFVLPIFLPTVQGRWFDAGLAFYIGGSAIYYTSWIILVKAQDDYLRSRPWLTLAPAYAPLLFLSGMAMMTESPLLLTCAVLFIASHVGEYLFRIERRKK